VLKEENLYKESEKQDIYGVFFLIKNTTLNYHGK